MRDPQPSFETIFDEELFSADAAPVSPATADIEELFAETGDIRVGGHVTAGRAADAPRESTESAVLIA